MKIVETDNFGRDYPNERFLSIPCVNKKDAKAICDAINESTGPNASRYWMPVENDYVLQEGFVPYSEEFEHKRRDKPEPTIPAGKGKKHLWS